MVLLRSAAAGRRGPATLFFVSFGFGTSSPTSALPLEGVISEQGSQDHYRRRSRTMQPVVATMRRLDRASVVTRVLHENQFESAESRPRLSRHDMCAPLPPLVRHTFLAFVREKAASDNQTTSPPPVRKPPYEKRRPPRKLTQRCLAPLHERSGGVPCSFTSSSASRKLPSRCRKAGTRQRP